MDSPLIPFTAHNIELPDRTLTRPGASLTAKEPVTQAVLRTLDLFFPPAGRAHTTVIDLGCLEGGYTVEFARAGFDATGLEAREVNFSRCQLVASQLRLPNLHFVRDDVRNLAQYPLFDVVFCSGLLYHLDRPATFLKLLGERSRRLLILQTHYSLGSGVPAHFDLSELVEHDGHLGRWYREFAEEPDPDEVEASNWSSYGNSRSFWLERSHLIQAIRDAGFSTVYEQPDFVANNVTDHYIEEQQRSLFVAVR
ncbi:MAG: class I SAM-dependent methyltransferase [Candidatus Dormibacteria bacterium]